MSIVAEVLTSIKQRRGIEGTSIGGDGISVEVTELAKRAGEAKVAVIQTLESQYVEFSTALQDTSMLQSRVTQNLQQLEALQCSLGGEVQNAVSDSVDAVHSVAAAWQEAVAGLKLCDQLLTVQRELKTASECSSKGQFRSSAKCLKKANELLEEVDDDIEIISGLIEELIRRRAELMCTLSRLWNETFAWEEHVESADKNKTFTLLIRKPKVESESTLGFEEMLGALSMLNELTTRVNALADKIHNKFFRVLVSRNANVSFSQSGYCHSLSVKFSTVAPHDAPLPNEVFLNVNRLLNSLLDTGYGIKFEYEEKKPSKSDDHNISTVTLMRLIGDKIAEKFTNILISDCLSSSVPYSRKHLQDFDSVKTAIQEFHEGLVKIGFYKSSEMSILNYASNVDSVFSTKSCSYLLDKARSLISQPLHNTVTITPTENYPNLAIENILDKDELGVKLEKSSLRLQKVLSAKSFHIPKCQVSKSIVSLVDLIYDTLDECCSSTPAYAGKLLYTVRNILSLYEHITPIVHANTLTTIPQHAALIHNNSLFLSNHCYLLAHQYRMRLPEGLRNADPSVTSFTDRGYMITQLGTEVFCTSMKNHKKELLECIGSAQVTGEVPHESGVQQCLLQLQMLRNVWSDVLPYSVYNKAMATLINSVIREIIEKTLSLEDISESSATALTSTCHIIIDNGTSLFPHTPTDLDAPSSHKVGILGVKQWGRFEELLIVLSASLKELEIRWSDSKGPLAVYFTPDQTKTLIRALFQNTDRRAQLLASIKLQ